MVPDKILLFSADESMAHVVTSCLIESGFTVVRARHGIGASDLIQSEKPTLIILDMELPGIKSLAIIRSLRAEEINGRTPVILMGENIREEDVLIGLEVGADLCLLEAFHPQVFVARVRSLIRRTEPSKVF
jgi:DNA-binding response OmpR family regulator